LAVDDLECPHDGQLDRGVGHREDVDSLGQHGVAVRRDREHAELDRVDAAGEARDRRPDRILARDRIDRDVVVHRVVGEELDERIEITLRPAGAERLHDIDRLGHGARPYRYAAAWIPYSSAYCPPRASSSSWVPT